MLATVIGNFYHTSTHHALKVTGGGSNHSIGLSVLLGIIDLVVGKPFRITSDCVYYGYCELPSGAVVVYRPLWLLWKWMSFSGVCIVKVSNVYSYDTLYLSHTSKKDRMSVIPYLKIKTHPNFGRVPSVPQWVLPPLECTSTGSAAGRVLQIRDVFLKRRAVDILPNRIHLKNISTLLHHAEGELGGS